MTLSALLSKSGMVALLASTLFMVGCADNRGFEAIRVKTPIIDGKPVPAGEQDGDQDRPSGDDGALFVSERPQELNVEEEEKIVDEVIDNTTITYTEGADGEKVQRAPEELNLEKAEIKEDIKEVIKSTKALEAKAQYLKGISLLEMEGSTAENKAFEVNAVVEVAKGRGGFTATVEAALDKDTKKIAGVVTEVKWHQADLGVLTEVRAICVGTEQDLCSKVQVLLRLDSEGKIQAFLQEFVRDGQGYPMARASSTHVVGFEEAQNGVTRGSEQTEPEDSQQDPVEQEAADVEQKGITPASGKSHRQSEIESMQQYEAMKADQARRSALSNLQEKKAQAQEKILQKSNSAQPQAKKMSQREAEIASMKKYEAMKAEQARRNALSNLQEKKAQAQERIMNPKTSSQKATSQSFRQAEIESMKKLEAQKEALRKQRIQNILNKNKVAEKNI